MSEGAITSSHETASLPPEGAQDTGGSLIIYHSACVQDIAGIITCSGLSQEGRGLPVPRLAASMLTCGPIVLALFAGLSGDPMAIDSSSRVACTGLVKSSKPGGPCASPLRAHSPSPSVLECYLVLSLLMDAQRRLCLVYEASDEVSEGTRWGQCGWVQQVVHLLLGNLWRACMVMKNCLSRQGITQNMAHDVMARHLISSTWLEQM